MGFIATIDRQRIIDEMTPAAALAGIQRGPSLYSLPRTVEWVSHQPNVAKLVFGYIDNETTRLEHNAQGVVVEYGAQSLRIMSLTTDAPVANQVRPDQSAILERMLHAIDDFSERFTAARNYARAVRVVVEHLKAGATGETLELSVSELHAR